MKYEMSRPILVSNYRGLSVSDRSLLEFVNAFTEKEFKYNLKELAKLTFTSESTISRFVRKLGFESYKRFVIHININLTEFNKKYPRYKETSVAGITKNIVNTHMYSIVDGLEESELFKIEKLIKRIKKAKRLIIWGLGASWKVASEFTANLQRIGIDASCPSDFHILLPIVGGLNKDSEAIIISNNSINKEVLFVLRKAKEFGANTTLVTSNGLDASLYANEIIQYKKIHVEGAIVPIASKTSQTIVMDIIFQCLIKSDKKYEQNLKMSMNILDEWRKI